MKKYSVIALISEEHWSHQFISDSGDPIILLTSPVQMSLSQSVSLSRSGPATFLHF